ncbi:hypothetical protein NBH19_02585 [Rhizobium sp. S95]|uniref:Uncharacterized protein n=1 Tax=Ciceribacter sichuanensis TaxID=2949647 RepID=A0AAJ1F533_9HYPH|nr:MULTISPECIES: hypothetical protein [unclassified Ciceribacter]MCM2394965.1 hypothetical protein [Ciceribacter sp. S95]MCO5955387.1 hypothetical protein [Ciceribacter sp. S101]
MRRSLTASLAFFALAVPALASSDGAWEEFAADVKKKCLEAAEPKIEKAAIAVDPFGSERFGLAVLSGKAKGGDAKVTYVCVYDKQAQTVELGSELTADTITVTIPEGSN